MIFALLFGAFMHARRQDPALFEAGRLTLNPTVGGVDTLLPLTSSWLAAAGLAFKNAAVMHFSRLIAGAADVGDCLS